MHTAQAGDLGGSVLGSHIPSTSSHGPLTAPCTAPLWSRPSIPAAGTTIQPPAPYTPLQHPRLTIQQPAAHLARSRSHLSAIPPTASTPAPVAPTSSQGFGPCAGTSLQHPVQAITAAPLAPAPHFASVQPSPSVIPATSTPGATTSSSIPPLPRPAVAPCAILRAPAPHLRHRLSVTPGTTNPAAPLAPSPHFASFQTVPLVIPATSTPGATTSSSTPPLPCPATATATRDILRAPAPHLRRCLSVTTPGTTNPAPSNSPSSLAIRPYAGTPPSLTLPLHLVLYSRDQQVNLLSLGLTHQLSLALSPLLMDLLEALLLTMATSTTLLWTTDLTGTIMAPAVVVPIELQVAVDVKS